MLRAIIDNHGESSLNIPYDEGKYGEAFNFNGVNSFVPVGTEGVRQE
jgi:hypothetical protein